MAFSFTPEQYGQNAYSTTRYIRIGQTFDIEVDGLDPSTWYELFVEGSTEASQGNFLSNGAGLIEASGITLSYATPESDCYLIACWGGSHCSAQSDHFSIIASAASVELITTPPYAAGDSPTIDLHGFIPGDGGAIYLDTSPPSGGVTSGTFSASEIGEGEENPTIDAATTTGTYHWDLPGATGDITSDDFTVNGGGGPPPPIANVLLAM